MINPKEIKINTKHNDTAYKYAWDWFEYHAKQRLTTFHFFLIILFAMGYGYIWAWKIDKLISLAIGIAGAFASLAFLMLEIRNTLLVNDGRQALDNLEGILKDAKGLSPFNKLKIRDIDVNQRNTFYDLFSHTVWLRLILSASIALSLCGTYYALIKLNKFNFNICYLYAIFGLSIVIYIFSLLAKKLK